MPSAKAMRLASLTIVLAVASGPALAAGDVAVGEKEFNKCKTCHSIVAPDGTVVQKGGKVGPDLYGVIGRPAGTVEGFKYSDGILAAGEAGLVWDEASFVAYVQDPTAFLKTYDPEARGKMMFKLKSGMEDVYAYLASVAPPS